MDDTFTMNKARVIKLCELILKHNIKAMFEGGTRADLVDEELIKIISDSNDLSFPDKFVSINFENTH
jgi:hypothetical protein